MDLAALLERCRHQDELAWEAFVRHFQGRVYSIAAGYASGRDETRDLAQDIFVRLYETRGRWVPADTFQPWLIRVARNVCLDQLRRKKSRPPAEDVQADAMVDLASAGPDPEEATEASSRRRLVWRALQSLGQISREIVLLKDIQGLALEDIASLLRIPVGTVKSRSNRARLELAERVLALQGGMTAPPQPGG